MTCKKIISSQRKAKGEYVNGLAKWDKCVDKTFDASMHTVNQRHYQGQISKELTNKLISSFKNCNKVLLELDCTDGFVYSSIGQKQINIINENFYFFDLQRPLLSVIKEICEFMEADITKYLCCPFRVINTRMYRATRETAVKVGSNRKHVDGYFPKGMHKVLLYLNGASVDSGFTRLIGGKKSIDIVGPPGTYILFNPCVTYHHGVSPQKYNKDTLEVTLCPWHETILEPVCGGPNSRHPIWP